jgi:hypothetical protein
MAAFSTRSPLKMQARPGRIWQKARIGFLPQQSITDIAKRYPDDRAIKLFFMFVTDEAVKLAQIFVIPCQEYSA